MPAICQCRCLFALSSSLTFLIPYFSRKGDDNIARKVLSMTVFRLHFNQDWPSNQRVWLHYLMQVGTPVLGRIGWDTHGWRSGMCCAILPLIPVDVGTYLSLVPTYGHVLCRDKTLSCPSLMSFGESFHFHVGCVNMKLFFFITSGALA